MFIVVLFFKLFCEFNVTLYACLTFGGHRLRLCGTEMCGQLLQSFGYTGRWWYGIALPLLLLSAQFIGFTSGVDLVALLSHVEDVLMEGASDDLCVGAFVALELLVSALLEKFEEIFQFRQRHVGALIAERKSERLGLEFSKLLTDACKDTDIGQHDGNGCTQLILAILLADRDERGCRRADGFSEG